MSTENNRPDTPVSGSNVVAACSQQDCENVAEYIMYWPGQQRSFVCPSCKLKAEAISEVLGFVLVTEPIAG